MEGRRGTDRLRTIHRKELTIMQEQSVDAHLIKKLAVRFTLLPLILIGLIIAPAGTLAFWQAYVYGAVIMIPMAFVVFYFLRNDPEFLQHRLKVREAEKTQKWITAVGSFAYVAGFLLPGFDRRFGWSQVPTAAVLAADVLVLLGYLFIVYVFRINRYASRVIEIQQGQKVITIGPYAVVRHPMYVGVIVMMLSTPIALGSYWAFVPFSLVPLTFIVRIRNEEKVLSEQLPGYKEYCAHTRFRLLPYVW